MAPTGLPSPSPPGPCGALLGPRLRLRAIAFDAGNSRAGSWVAAHLAYARAVAGRVTGTRATALSALLAAHRFSLRLQDPGGTALLQRRIEPALRTAAEAGEFTSLALPPIGTDYSKELPARSIVLKAPRITPDGTVLERGVLLITFTHLFGELARSVDIPRLTKTYTLVLEPSWSGYAHAEILQFVSLSSSPVFVMATEPRDFAFLERFHPRLIPLPFGASDWVDPAVFTPGPKEAREFDAGYIGFWGAVKRHHVLFRALRNMADPSFRVALIGGAWQGTKEEIAALARWYGVLDQLTFFEGLRAEQVSAVIGHCKVSMLLSLKEGSNRGLFESMFSGTPALLLRDNIGVRRDYVNSATGRIIAEGELAEALMWFREHWSDFDPRRWALEHIAPEATAAALNQTLRSHAAQAGEPWTADCVPKVNRPEVAYLKEEDRVGLAAAGSVLTEFSLGR